MPATLGTIKLRVRNLVGTNVAIDDEELTRIIQAEHDTVLNDNSWTGRRAQGTFVTVAPYETGTVTTSGTTVTGSGTTFTSAMVNRWIRINDEYEFYKVTAFGGATSLTIERAVASGDVSTASTYSIFQHIYQLPSDCERIIGLLHRDEIPLVSVTDLNLLDPYRHSTGDTPRFYSYVELTTPTSTVASVRQIELHPIPSAAYMLRVQYLKSNELKKTEDRPLYRSDVLVWKSAASATYMLYAKTGDTAWADLSDRYMSQYNLSLQGAKIDDLGKYAALGRIRDVYSVGPGSRQDVSRDPWYDA